MKKTFYLMLTVVCLMHLVVQQTWADNYTKFFTDIMVAGGDENVRFVTGWNSYDQDLNKNAGGDYIYLLYKTATVENPPGGYITDFRLRKGSDYPESFEEDGMRWYRAPYTGGKHFCDLKGDLNSNAGGDDIHLYYTKDEFDDKRVVTGVYFNSKKNGSVGNIDLNDDAGGDDIYMHVTYFTQGKGQFDDPYNAFTWHPSGRGCMHFKLLTTSFTPFRTFHNATYYLKDENGKTYDIFKSGETNSDEKTDSVQGDFQNLMSHESVLFLTNSTRYSPKYCLVSGDKNKYGFYRNDGKGKKSGDAYAELDWYYPASLGGKTYLLCVRGEIWHVEDGHTEKLERELGSIDFEEMALETYDAVPGTEAGEENQIKIPCVSDHPISWLQAIYKDDLSSSDEKKLDKVAMKDNTYAGFLMLPAREAHKYTIVHAGVITSSWDKDKLGDPNWPTSNTNMIEKVLENTPIIHAPVSPAVSCIPYTGAVQLNWSIDNMDFPDIIDGDQFMVQRSLTGKEEDFKEIGSVVFDLEQKDYTFTDSTFISSLTSLDYLDAGVPYVKYRIVRAAALQLWGKNDNCTAVTLKPNFGKLKLQIPRFPSAEWSNKEESKVLVKWYYLEDDEGTNLVWDPRAKMTLLTEMFDRSGNSVGKENTVLTEEQIAKHEMELTLHRSCVRYTMTLIIDKGQSLLETNSDVQYRQVTLPADGFYYQNSGKINKSSLSARTLQSSVLLEWTTDGGAIDYFVVRRRDLAKGPDAWVTLASELSDMQYEDKSTSPRHTYEYCVLAAIDCEGIDHQSTDTIPGQCKQTGTVEGFLRFSDGTGIPGLEINISSTDGSVQVTVTTDESGHFRQEDLPYWGESLSGAYRLAPNLNGYSDQKLITFGTEPGTNYIKDVTFYVEDNVRFSGYVLYQGTSIPVPGVSFLLDCREVQTSSGKVTTDFEGKFSFRMLPGNHSIQAVKDGHTFFQRGFYYETNDTTKKEHNFSIDKAGVYFYDNTRVELIGRVAGGKDQEALPLNNSLSRNNLGDDLEIVLTLEGDRASRLVWDIQNANLKETDEMFPHKSLDNKAHATTVHTTLYRKVVKPDVLTGEYRVLLPPVKWKIEQITAKGYASLFQDGHTSDVIDLTDSLTKHTEIVEGHWYDKDGNDVTQLEVEYNAKYNRIYHTPVNISYKQLTYDTFDYFGNRNYTAKGLDGTSVKVELVRPVRKANWPAHRKDSLMADYTFGYPVFSIERTYPIRISATEKYYYNNSQNPDSLDVVRLAGGKVTIQNAFLKSTHREEIELDSVGEYIYPLKAAQIPYMITGEQALRTLTMTLHMDGTYYEAEPLRAYILNISPIAGTKDVLSVGKPILVDILRDPPGATSSAKLSKGSSLSSTFTLNMKMARGVNLNIGAGTAWDTWQGVGTGIWSAANNAFELDLKLVWNNNSDIAYNYVMTANSDISTSSNKYVTGADGDVYMGINTNVIMKPAVAIRAITNSIYQTQKGEEKAGRLKVIARGYDPVKKDSLFLVRSETMAVGQEIESTFAHSQQYITNQLLPELEEQCRSLMFTGSREEAQRQANMTGRPVYMSLREPSDPCFAMVNTKEHTELGETDFEVVFNDSIFEAEDGINYVIVNPANHRNMREDQVADFYQSMLYWASMIAQNEQEKLSARTLMKNFDVDGGTGVTYSEQFSTQFSSSESQTDITTNFRYGDRYADFLSGFGLAYNTVAKTIVKFGISQLFKNILKKTLNQGNKDGNPTAEIRMTGWKWHLKIDPVVSCDFTPKYGSVEQYTRKESFTISMDRRSHLNFDVYYADAIGSITDQKDWNDVFVNDNYHHYDEKVVEAIYNKLSNLSNTARHSRGFIYRTRGGSTLRTWENERRTLFYAPGTLLDERTKRVENPVIKMDKQSLSGVPFGEPARFKVYLANESEQAEAAYPYLELTLRDQSNPLGAKVMMDGMPLSGSPRTMNVEPGKVTEKTIEVFASENFDYENLRLRLSSLEDIVNYQEATFSVHFLQTAGGLSITTPGDKWVMNTDAAKDSNRGWFLPVVIADFDRNQPNFDHIEFQFKESARGDNYWTNLCSFFTDSTYYNAASGTKEMIPANGNITTRFYGEGTVMEKGYDLRAVLFCRNGNGYLTTASKVLSGVKDTRRPALFGTPEPKDGILDVGEDVVFNFSEPIEYNFLQETTNFEVRGETNENTLEESVALQFGGEGYAESEARRNFGDKDVTIEVMIQPENEGKDMPIFSHGTDGRQLQLWLTAQRTLRAVVDDRTVEGTTQLNSDGFQRVALVINSDQQTVSIYADKLEGVMDSVIYTGNGPVIFGATNHTDATKRQFYKGRMLQGRVWNRALDLVLLNSYGNKLLTGYEMGLTDYYPMNDGAGHYAKDEAQGAHLMLKNVGWSLPRNMSLRLDFNTVQPDGTKGLKLKSDFFTRDSEQDYTLMFWFRTNGEGKGALISNGSGRTTDVEAKNSFFIGFEGDSLKYRANGVEQYLGSSLSDDVWHHYAMTMNHTHQVANIYIDFVQRASFTTENIGGMGGDHFYLGNMVWTEEGIDNDVLHQQNALTGWIDGLTLFEQALPVALVERYGRKGLGGREKGLKTWLDFCRQERQPNGELQLVPYAMNKVIKLDADGNVSDRNDTVFVLPPEKILAQIDRNHGAPVHPYEELRELKFGFVGVNHQLMVNVDELDSRINKRRVYVTISDIPDMNGNMMASPATIAFTVDRNSLRWGQRTLKLEGIPYGSENTFDIAAINESGANHTYSINNMPKWLTVNKQMDLIGPREERMLRFTISKDVNIGTYDHIIYLTDENGLTEPLSLTVEVKGDEPQWKADTDKSQYSMTLVGKVRIKDDIVTNSRDLVGVFDTDGRCMGSTHVSYNAMTAESMAYLTVYDGEDSDVSDEMDARPLTFKLWHYQTGKVMVLTPSERVTFKANGSVGTTKEPIVLRADDSYVQHLELTRGWNWISFNVYDNAFRQGKTILDRYSWKEGDMIVDDANKLALRYKSGQWISNEGEDGINNIQLDISKSYRIKSVENRTIEVPGSILRQKGYRSIRVRGGWNNIGYTPMLNLPVATALADYFNEAEDGDVIKNRTEFAMFTVSDNGQKGWKGNLQYMKPGEGYLLYRKTDSEVSFVYPFFEPNTTFIDNGNMMRSELLVNVAEYANTMSLTAVVEGIDVEEGDRLMAMNGAEVRGEAIVHQSSDISYQPSLTYMSIAGNQKMPLYFAIERQGDIIATTSDVLIYEPDAISGSPKTPTVISFVRSETVAQDGWYSLQGIKLQEAPTRSGVYIFNGKKQIIK